MYSNFAYEDIILGLIVRLYVQGGVMLRNLGYVGKLEWC